ISWNTEAGSSDLLSAALNISNGGGGIFKWTAASDSAWLSVSATAGSDAQTIMVSADPSGQPANSSTSGTITLQALDGADQVIQTVTVPVTIHVGNPGYGEAPGVRIIRFVYLPYLAR
ncbi:MAG: BACON domain-containing protein, partial [Oscillochloris sp.]|nr:BACON domain-containing protein [Oscillochloris sp.]